MNGPTASSYPSSHATSHVNGVKRKREGKTTRSKFYAVRVGRAPGIYHTWEECLRQVQGFSKPAYKSFGTLTEAQQFVEGNEASSANQSGAITKWYAVRAGRNPGVYTSYADVLDQITGWKNPKHRAFKTKAEADRFVADGTEPHGESSYAGHGQADHPDREDIAQPAAKKAKKGKKSAGTKDEEEAPESLGGAYEPGDGPLPPNAEDNFDPTIVLDETTGLPRYKRGHEQLETRYEATAPRADAPIKIHTDGSSLGNGTQASISGVGVYFGPRDARNISEPLAGPRQTNQRAELTAVLRALEVAPRDRKIIIYSDSNYAIKCTTDWFRRWRSNGWVNASHKPVENRDLVQKIVEMLEDRLRMNAHRAGGAKAAGGGGGEGAHWDQGPAGVKFVWVKGHSTDEGNNAADGLATAAAREAREMLHHD